MGDIEAMVQAQMEHHMLNVAKTVEAELDAKIKAMDDLRHVLRITVMSASSDLHGCVCRVHSPA
ncbi:hypothetical protein N9995_00295 [bacterium]|nr:hypothetical protein [bacterium]